MGFPLTQDDEAVLAGVHPDLARVVRRAAADGDIQFYVRQGARSQAEQIANIKKGVSKTMKSRHIVSPNGYAHAVDLIPAYNGKWEMADWEAYYPLAIILRDAANVERIPVEWGGVWDKALNGLTDNTKAEVASYTARQRKAGNKKILLDGPHFQLPWKQYPGTDQPINNLIPDEEIAVISEAEPKMIGKTPAVVAVVEQDLREDGSRIIAEGDTMTTVGKIGMGTAGATTVAKETGILDQVTSYMEYIPTLKTMLYGLSGVGAFLLQRWYLVAVVVFFIIWRSGYRVKFFRAQATIEGRDVVGR